MNEQGATPAVAKITRRRTGVVTPPYVSFTSFLTLIDWLRSEGIPIRFDRSFWQAKFSGSTGTQLVATLRFFRLLSGDIPAPILNEITNSAPDRRRVILKGLLKDSYESVPFESLDRATPTMIKGWFRAYPVDGHTLRKAISFFVNASKYAGVPMSNAVSRMSKNRIAVAANATLKRGKPVTGQTTVRSAPDGPPRTLDGETVPPDRTTVQPNRIAIALKSGGSIAVDVTVDLFKLSDQDRKFILALVDLTRTYQNLQNRPSTDTDNHSTQLSATQ